MPDVVRPCVLPKGHSGMSRPTSSDHLYNPRAMIACMHNVVQVYMLSKGDCGMPRPTLSDRVSCLRAMQACHAQ